VLVLHWKTALLETLPKECLVELIAYQSQITVTKNKLFPIRTNSDVKKLDNVNRAT
jgi:hypothetical protein